MVRSWHKSTDSRVVGGGGLDRQRWKLTSLSGRCVPGCVGRSVDFYLRENFEETKRSITQYCSVLIFDCGVPSQMDTDRYRHNRQLSRKRAFTMRTCGPAPLAPRG